MSGQQGTAEQSGHTAGAFDIRTIIALLFVIYGVVLTVMGLAATSAEDLAKADGLNINLWSGIGMVVVAVLFALWVWLRPIIVPASGESEAE
ncbi:hypothetical protein [Parasphingorhabdus pacifica]